jgi:hypothetical protein
MTQNDDTDEIITALHYWLQSQDIPRQRWGYIFATAAGNEIKTLIAENHNPEYTTMGQVILTTALVRACS